jgi:hypothetical protein
VHEALAEKIPQPDLIIYLRQHKSNRDRFAGSFLNGIWKELIDD